jgi:hypothetical protein
MRLTRRESVSILGCALLLAGAAGCASAPEGPPIEAPRLVAGDHWQYRVVDQLRRGAISRLDVEVISAAADTARIRVDFDDGATRSEWVDEVDARGGLRAGILSHESPRRFDPPAQLLAFPLVQGKTWRQTIETFRRDVELRDQIQIYGQVGERRMTTVTAGGYDAVYVYRILRLDDAEFWRTRTTRRDAIWYAAGVKASVREAREAEYTEIGGPDVATVRTESTVRELVSFRPGAR